MLGVCLFDSNMLIEEKSLALKCLINSPLEKAVSSSKIKITFPAHCRGRFIDKILLCVDCCVNSPQRCRA